MSGAGAVTAAGQEVATAKLLPDRLAIKLVQARLTEIEGATKRYQ